MKPDEKDDDSERVPDDWEAQIVERAKLLLADGLGWVEVDQWVRNEIARHEARRPAR